MQLAFVTQEFRFTGFGHVAIKLHWARSLSPICHENFKQRRRKTSNCLARKLSALDRSNNLTQASLLLRRWILKTNCSFFDFLSKIVVLNRWGCRSRDAEINKRHIESYNVVDIRSEIDMELFCRRCAAFLLLLWTFYSMVFAQQQGKQR